MQNQCRQPGINVNVGCRIRNIACSYLPIAAGELVYPLVFTYRWYVCCVLCVTCAIVCITWWWRPGHTKNVDILIQCVCVWYFYLTVFTDNDQRQLAQRIRCAYQEYYCYRAFWVSTFYFSFGYMLSHQIFEDHSIPGQKCSNSYLQDIRTFTFFIYSLLHTELTKLSLRCYQMCSSVRNESLVLCQDQSCARRTKTAYNQEQKTKKKQKQMTRIECKN